MLQTLEALPEKLQYRSHSLASTRYPSGTTDAKFNSLVILTDILKDVCRN